MKNVYVKMTRTFFWMETKHLKLSQIKKIGKINVENNLE